MSFTPDELQSLNAIFDHKTAELLHELELFFDGKMQIMRKEFVQYQQRLVDGIDRSFATQLLAVEQLINQRFPAADGDSGGDPRGRHDPLRSTQPLRVPIGYTDLPQTGFEAIEVQTEIPWEDLIDLLNKALNERFITFNTSLQARLQDIAYAVSSQIQILHDDLCKEQPMAPFSGKDSGQERRGSGQGQAAAPTSLPTIPTEAEMQDILTSINQLESIVESMQVAMTANSTLISNRLYHHQHLPVERAHPPRSFSPSEHEYSVEREWNLSSFPPGETQE